MKFYYKLQNEKKNFAVNKFYIGLLIFYSAMIAMSCSNSTTPVNNNNNNNNGGTTPKITSLSQNSTYASYPLGINGNNFNFSRGDSYVELNGVKITTYEEWRDNYIGIVLPKNATTGDLTVTVGGVQSNAVSLTINQATGDAPAITYIDVAQQRPRQAISIIGKNFGSSQGPNYVDFNGVRADEYQSWNDSKIVCMVPTGATSGDVTVWVNAQASNGENLNILTDNILLGQVLIPAGEFMMGEDSSSSGSDISPGHLVKITKPFYMSKFEITQSEYDKIELAGNDHSRNKGANNPVENVAWVEACQFCNDLSKREFFDQVYTINGNDVSADWTKNGYRLPTEAEWEYAARAGGTGLYGKNSNGMDGTLPSMGWYNGNANGGTHEVGQKNPNYYGLYDMLGNVAEWCWDWADDSYYGNSPVEDPRGPEQTDTKLKVIRGGSYIDGLSNVNVIIRASLSYDSQVYNFNLGFRVVRNAK